jgi:hypothetical protein
LCARAWPVKESCAHALLSLLPPSLTPLLPLCVCVCVNLFPLTATTVWRLRRAQRRRSEPVFESTSSALQPLVRWGSASTRSAPSTVRPPPASSATGQRGPGTGKRLLVCSAFWCAARSVAFLSVSLSVSNHGAFSRTLSPQNRGLRLDYWLVSPPLEAALVDAFVCDHLHGSDHCPVGIDLDVSRIFPGGLPK